MNCFCMFILVRKKLIIIASFCTFMQDLVLMIPINLCLCNEMEDCFHFLKSAFQSLKSSVKFISSVQRFI